jgi:hypothetical protein
VLAGSTGVPLCSNRRELHSDIAMMMASHVPHERKQCLDDDTNDATKNATKILGEEHTKKEHLTRKYKQKRNKKGAKKK